MNNFQCKVKALKNELFNVEVFNSANEVVETNSHRNITDSRFDDMSDPNEVNESFTGVKSLDEACELMKKGYAPSVEKLKDGLKGANVQGQGKRITFHNDVVGFAPIVPLALQGVPASMQNTRMKPIKAKVLNIYYNMSATCGVSSEDIMKAGVKLLSAIMELEMQGYKFNLYAVQNYYVQKGGCDMLCTKVKSSNTPLDLKRISFPLTHTAYFRVIGFDWYSRTPNGKFRYGYGRPLSSHFKQKDIQSGFEEIFKQKCVVFSCPEIIENDVDYIKGVVTKKGGTK